MKYLLSALCLISFAVFAQSGDKAPSERAKKDAEKVFSWLKIADVKPTVPPKPKQPDPAVAQTTKKAPEPKKPTQDPVVARAPESQASSVQQLEPVDQQVAATIPVPVIPEPEKEIILTIISQEHPQIPERELSKITKADILVAFYVTKDGSTDEIIVFDNKYPRVAKYIEDAVKKWKFAPIRAQQYAEVVISIDNTKDGGK